MSDTLPTIDASFMATQAARQHALRAFERHVVLDWTPFASGLIAYDTRRTRVEMLLRGADIAAMRSLLRRGTLSAVGLTLHYLARIKRHSALNAVITLNPDALDLARAADTALAAGHATGPLHGIPILLKDNIGTGDRMPNTAGAAALLDARSDRDAFLVSRLRAAGAVILGKANLSEWANFFADEPPPNGFSAAGGQTWNPYGGFDVGGSSAGSGAAAAAHLCAAAVGTETHGSIIYPCLRNALYGLKPSLGLVSRDRIIPITDASDTAGPMARCVGDLAALMDGMAGADPADPECVALATDPRGAGLLSEGFAHWAQPGGLKGVRIGVLPADPTESPLDAAHADLARARLRAAGALLIECALPALDLPFLRLLNHGFVTGVAAYLEATGAPLRTLAEVLAFNVADPARRAPNGMGRMRAALADDWTAADYAAQKPIVRAACRAALHETKQAHGLDLFVSLDQGGVGWHFVMAGAPLLALPAGLLPDGQPYGITLGGEWLDDGKLIAAARAWELSGPPRPEPFTVTG